ncbi:MAG: pitrilysin family protein [Gammaproteobacteria bacterium]|nr:MAG: pitrilysin family protein [Gammaproteobacteria bacterium]
MNVVTTINRYMQIAFLAGLGLMLLPAISFGAVSEYMLDNGLKVLVKPDRRAPVVVSQIWYKVGSSYEYEGITGLSHMLEHMLFRGTKKIPSGEFSKIISANGGRENAFTGGDYTAYFQRLEKSRLAVSFELEADRMMGALIPKDEFLKERDVVAEERRLRTEDKPQSLTYEQFRAAAFVSSPYHHSVIGWMGDILNYTRDDAMRWYKRWYTPNNATLVVVGDIEPGEVLSLAKKFYGPLKPGEVVPPKPRPEVVQKGERRVELKLPAKLPYVLMGYKVPSLNTAKDDKEVYALEVLTWILDGGDSARFSRELIRGRQIAATTSVSYDYVDRLETLLTVAAIPATGTNLEEMEQALRDQIKRLREKPVSEAELKRVKTQIVTREIFSRDSVFYQAMQLGRWETTGIGWQSSELFVDHIKKVTAQKIMEVARKYLGDDQLTVALLKPQPIKAKRSTATRSTQRVRH